MEIDLAEPTRPQLAEVFGCSSRWIGELRAKGAMPVDGASLLENIEAWALYKYGRDPQSGDGISLDAERARLAREQADAKAMDNAERRKELASLPDMTVAVMTVISLAVSRLMQVPARVAKSDNALRTRIETAITDALEELSVTRVEQMGGGLDDESPEAEADV
jgi:phage terminase Nu1 subunit (DNA packaging protein)